MARYNAIQENYEEVTVLDNPALFTPLRIDRNTIPHGYHLYEARHNDNGDPVQIARGIMANHLGSLICCDEIELPFDGYLRIKPDAINHGTGDCRSMKDFMEKYPPKVKPS